MARPWQWRRVAERSGGGCGPLPPGPADGLASRCLPPSLRSRPAPGPAQQTRKKAALYALLVYTQQFPAVEG